MFSYSVSALLFNGTRRAFILVKQFRPGSTHSIDLASSRLRALSLLLKIRGDELESERASARDT